MESQPSTSSAGASTAGSSASDGGPSSTDAVEEAVPSTSGSVVVPVRHQPELKLFISGGASFKQCQQLFGATCRVKLQRCRISIPVIPADNDPSVPAPSAEERSADPRTVTVSKVEEDSDSTGSGSCSDDDEVKVLPVCAPPAAPRPTKKRPVTKKKAGQKGLQRKSSAYCTVCKKTLSSKYNLKIHMARHSGERRYKCEKCPSSFWSSSSLAHHNKSRDQRNGVCPPVRKTVEGWRPKGAWNCRICGKRMKTGGSYPGHMRIHRGDKPFKCGECGKGFGRKDELSEHERIHSGVWQFTCLFCDKGFHQQQSLFSHLRLHTEEKPFFVWWSFFWKMLKL